MKIKFYHIDTFTTQYFTGNPATVCLPEQNLDDTLLQSIARENHLPVTAFLLKTENEFFIRWFTPTAELDLCGHGTLATAFVLFNFLHPTKNFIELHSSKAGKIRIRRSDTIIEINFPKKMLEPIAISDILISGLNNQPREIYQHKKERILAVLANEADVANIQLNHSILKSLEHRGIIITAPSAKYDFVSRTFYSHKEIPEDSVTGASHCLLVPYWAQRLNKNKLHAFQLSSRGGELFCELAEDYVVLGGNAKLYSEGEIMLDN